MIKLLILLQHLLVAPVHADRKDKICGVVSSYTPPATRLSPHKLSLGSVELIIWQEDVEIIEIHPPDLVCSRLCVTGRIKSDLPYSKKLSMVIRKYEQVEIIEMLECPEAFQLRKKYQRAH